MMAAKYRVSHTHTHTHINYILDRSHICIYIYIASIGFEIFNSSLFIRSCGVMIRGKSEKKRKIEKGERGIKRHNGRAMFGCFRKKENMMKKSWGHVLDVCTHEHVP